MRVVLSHLAQRDVEGIWDYSALAWGIDCAETYIRQIQLTLQVLAADPRLGRHVT